MKDSLGDELKKLEQQEAGKKADPYLPLMARLDGKCFSKFTQNLQRPFDKRFIELMIETTKYIVEESEANLGYCQSDEITLYWDINKKNYSNRELWFGGKFQKLTSVLAATASSFFTSKLPSYLSEKVGQIPVFDARVWNVPDSETVYKNFLWRLVDCKKNSVSMYAREFFSHKELMYKSTDSLKSMLKDINKPWEELPDYFKFGTYMRRQRILVDPSEFVDVPEKYRPTKPVLRTMVKKWEPKGPLSIDWFTYENT